MKSKILVVDDEPGIRAMLQDAFDRVGYEVIPAESAENALDILQTENVQVMFVDLKLPGMNGLELCRRIRKQHPITYIYAITGYTSLFELADCREAGFDDYFTKPVDLKLFFQAAQEGFDKLSRQLKMLLRN